MDKRTPEQIKKTRIIQAGLGFGYAGIFLVVILISHFSNSTTVNTGDILLPLIIICGALSIPGFIGLAGKKIPFIFSFIITVLTSGIIVTMLYQSDDVLGVICVSIFFIPIAIGIIVIAGAISGVYLLIAKIVNMARSKDEDNNEVK